MPARKSYRIGLLFTHKRGDFAAISLTEKAAPRRSLKRRVTYWIGIYTIPDTRGRGGVLPYKGLMGACGEPGYVFRDFCLKQGFDSIIFCLNQGIDFINFCLKQGIFSWRIKSLRVCSTN